MNDLHRRQIIQMLGFGVMGMPLISSAHKNLDSAKQLALSFDDPDPMLVFKSKTIVGKDFDLNKRILLALKDAGDIKAALFVCGKRIEQPGGATLLKSWNQAGHLLGNHSYSHLYYHSKKVTYETYSRDILKNEPLIKSYSTFTKLFRYPFLKEGDTLEKRDRLRTFLKANQYRNGHVTVDTSDWYINQRMLKRLSKDAKTDLKPYERYYQQHLLDRLNYYQSLSKQIMKRNIKHVMLLHYNLISALFLKKALRKLRQHGWTLIDASAAYQDPLYQRAPRVLPAGESLIWSLAKQSGKFEGKLRYPGEDGRYEERPMKSRGL